LFTQIARAIVAFVRGSSGPTPAYTRSAHGGDGITSYESLVEEREPIDGWTICTVCLNLDRTQAVKQKRWRCADCGVDASLDMQRELKDYLTENSAEKISSNLEQWNNTKGVRAAYKMLRSARYKCLLTLGKRLRGEPASVAAGGA
jgi:hypothetical protein